MSIKQIAIFTLLLLLFNCKQDKPVEDIKNIEDVTDVQEIRVDSVQQLDEDIQPKDKSITIELKQKQLIEKEDERVELQELIIDKDYVVAKEDYTINFNFPLLNESFKPTHENFNEFISDYYVNISKTESDILESKLICDSIAAKTFREERFIDYKIYNVNDELLSILFYKENFFNGAMHPSFSFDCFNFDLNKGNFMSYEDFFIQGSEEELLSIINEQINDNIAEGELYYDCWELTSDDFFEGKNNFVLNDTTIAFYFDDCIICPSYTGTYSIELPLLKVQPVLKKFESNPLVF